MHMNWTQYVIFYRNKPAHGIHIFSCKIFRNVNLNCRLTARDLQHVVQISLPVQRSGMCSARVRCRDVGQCNCSHHNCVYCWKVSQKCIFHFSVIASWCWQCNLCYTEDIFYCFQICCNLPSVSVAYHVKAIESSQICAGDLDNSHVPCDTPGLLYIKNNITHLFNVHHIS